MLVHYFNDERAPVSVRIMDSRYDPATAKGDFFYRLAACESKTFEVLLPEGAVLYVKKWPGMVMLSWMMESDLAHLGPTLPERSHQELPTKES